MPPHIAWTTEARNDLGQFCLQFGPTTSGEAAQQHIDCTLAAAFPDEATIIVRRLFAGFRARPKRHILLVDTGRGTFIAKLGEPDHLDREQQAFARSTPNGFSGNAVFLRLQTAPPSPPFLALQYQTAASNIELPETKSLEEAVLGAIAHQAPTVASVAAVLEELLDNIGQVCHQRSGVQPFPALQNQGRFDLVLNPSATGQPHSLRDTLACWSADPHVRSIRHDANAAFPIRLDQAIFIDPISFFEELLADRNANGFPSVRVGCAHGDLHGRNVIVGIRNNDACRPSLFDYEAMSHANLVAWDYAKLETELKIRAYSRLWPNGTLRRLAWEIGQFEQLLDSRTEHHNRNGNWPNTWGDSPCDRLRHLLFTIRRLAARHLGRDRTTEWLHEYYFVLAIYGLHTGRYPNPTLQERMGSYISAGVATSRFTWGMRDAKPDRPRDLLRQVWQLNRCANGTDHEQVATLAASILPAMQHDVRAWYESAFAQLKCGKRADAEATLQTAERKLGGSLDEDCYSLLGRCHKQAGHDAMTKAEAEVDPLARRPLWIQAETEYRDALKHYDRGYQLNAHPFPGINVAHLKVMQAAIAKRLNDPKSTELLAEAKQLSQDLIDSNRSSRWIEKLADDNIWLPATLGEAHLIREQWTEAADEYQRALLQPSRQPHHATSMREQVARLYAAFAILGIAPQGAIADVVMFFK